MSEDDVDEVVRLEQLLLEPEVRNNADQVLRHLHRNFHEYGASGRVWTRESVAEATSGTERRIVAANMEAKRLGADAVLLTYVSETDTGRRALRSSVWVRDEGSWLLLFHQGTLVPAPASSPEERSLPSSLADP